MVTVLAPTTSGTLGMVQAETGPVAVPEAAPVDQVTAIVPEPPEAEPDMLIADANVVEGGTVTVSVSGGVEGGGLGGVVAFCAAQSVNAAAASPAASVLTTL